QLQRQQRPRGAVHAGAVGADEIRGRERRVRRLWFRTISDLPLTGPMGRPDNLEGSALEWVGTSKLFRRKTMSEMKDLHHEAMRLADQADHLRRTGVADGARAHLRRALEHERRAAELAAADLSLEPTRSVLHRRAASLALECGDYREAERLIAVALAGSP